MNTRSAHSSRGRRPGTGAEVLAMQEETSRLKAELAIVLRKVLRLEKRDRMLKVITNVTQLEVSRKQTH